MTNHTMTHPALTNEVPATMSDTPPASTHFWDKIARGYAKNAVEDVPAYDRTLARTAAYLDADYRVLEIGCGTGSTALRLGGQVAEYVGADISPEMIAIANEKLAETHQPTVRFEVDDADRTRFAGRGYDAVLAYNLFHLVADLDDALAGARASLKPGGLLISKTACLKDMNPFIRWVMIPAMRLIGKAPKVLSFDQGELEAALKRAGFDVEAVEYHGTKGKDIRPFIVARKS